MIIRKVRAGIKLPASPVKRIAAYARVSSGKPEAEDSLETQTSYFEHYINSNASFELAGIYADIGISGTKPNRPEFQRMLEDARTGKIDLIITKSVSRFARNIVTLLSTLRELKELGIDVYFESENLHSISNSGEILITLLAMYAEDGARSASENKRWQIQRQFECGIPTCCRPLGLRWINGEFVIVPKEAKVVRIIFDLYLSGNGIWAIIKELEAKKLQPLISKKWSHITIYDILRNEKYAGDLLLQKYYRPDFRTKKDYRNKGEYRQYYIEDAHEAIISRDIFNKVQAEIKKRQKQVVRQEDFTERLFAGILKCHYCGRHFCRKHRSYNKSNYFWMCKGFLSYGVTSCSSKMIREPILIEKTKEALNLPDSQRLTRDIILDKISQIEVMPDKLCYYLKTGEVRTVTWKTPSRSKSWTPEMREKARLRTLSYYQNIRRKKQ